MATVNRLAPLLFALLLAAPALAQDQDQADILPAPGGARGGVSSVPGVRAGRAVDASKPVPWDDAAHRIFFNYQRWLASKGEAAETQESWAALKALEQHRKLEKTEELLKSKLAKLMSRDRLAPEDQEFVKQVWGERVAAAAVRVAAARASGDPEQIRKATAQAATLTKQVGGLNTDWNALFEGSAARGGIVAVPPAPGTDVDEEASVVHDYLKPSTKPDFLASLDSKETREALATQRSFSDFLSKHGVAAEAKPGMLAMYQVLHDPKNPEKDLSHILPTVVAFLKDGKPVEYDREAGKGAYGFAVPGDYDHPKAVKVTPEVIGADPVVVGKTLAHEFQHIYDMYTGRYYTLDSEMRGFEVAVKYFRALKAEAPAKYRELADSDNDSTRSIMRDVESYSKDWDESPQKFREAVAIRYQSREEGVFEGRMSLRETVDPRLESGAVVELATYKSRLAVRQKEVADLEGRLRDLQAKMAANQNSRDLDRELEKTAKDLAAARRGRDSMEQEVTVKQLRLKRMQSEVRWMDRAASAAGREAPPYDLSLPVDREYVVP